MIEKSWKEVMISFVFKSKTNHYSSLMRKSLFLEEKTFDLLITTDKTIALLL